MSMNFGPVTLLLTMAIIRCFGFTVAAFVTFIFIKIFDNTKISSTDVHIKRHVY